MRCVVGLQISYAYISAPAQLYFGILGLHFACLGIQQTVDWTSVDNFVNLSRIARMLLWQTDLISLGMFSMTFLTVNDVLSFIYRMCMWLVIVIAWFSLLEHLTVFRGVSRLVLMIELVNLFCCILCFDKYALLFLSFLECVFILCFVSCRCFHALCPSF